LAVSSSIDIDGLAVPIRLKRSGLASAMSLRLDQRDGSVILVLPDHVPQAKGLAFVRSKADWLRERIAALPQQIPFHAGHRLPLLGVEHELRPAPGQRRGVWAEDGVIHVCGQPEHFARRVGDWLKLKARDEIASRAGPMAETVERPLGRITLRDARTRWGSCTSRGDLAFSWRLILAPAEVLTYVVAHEVAHLVELNHSPAFWQVVERLSPHSKPARAWLKRHGARLHRYG
jgi:hypothetical protein